MPKQSKQPTGNTAKPVDESKRKEITKKAAPKVKEAAKVNASTESKAVRSDASVEVGKNESVQSKAAAAKITTIREARLNDGTSLVVNPYIPWKTTDIYEKRLYALSSHIANETSLATSSDRLFKVDTYEKLSQLDWTRYDDLIEKAKAKPGFEKTKETSFVSPVKARQGTGQSLRARWLLGVDVGGSEVLLAILLHVRFSASKVDKGNNRAPLFALCKIRATLLYLSEAHRNITEQDIEAIFQEIRARKDPKVYIAPEDGNVISQESGNGKQVKSAAPGAGHSGNQSSLALRSHGEPRQRSVWDIYAPILIAVTQRESAGHKIDPVKDYIAIPYGYRRYQRHMATAYRVVHKTLHTLTTGYPPPRWRKDRFLAWAEKLPPKYLTPLDIDFTLIAKDLARLRVCQEKDLETKEAEALLAQY